MLPTLVNHEARLAKRMNHALDVLRSELARLQEKIGSSQLTKERLDLIACKKDVQSAISLLESCRQNGVTATCEFIQLPQQKCETPSSQYRVVEDMESDDRSWWSEVDCDGRKLRLIQGDIVIKIP